MRKSLGIEGSIQARDITMLSSLVVFYGRKYFETKVILIEFGNSSFVNITGQNIELPLQASETKLDILSCAVHKIMWHGYFFMFSFTNCFAQFSGYWYSFFSFLFWGFMAILLLTTGVHLDWLWRANSCLN